METYPKIQTLFKRHLDGPKKGKMIRGEWTTPELEYLADNEWSFTEKVDGTNIRVLLSRVGDDLVCYFGGRSNNAVLPAPLKDYLDETFPSSPDGNHISLWMKDNDLSEVVLFGEGYGPKIQGGGKYRDNHSFVLFDVKIGDFWLQRKDVNDVADRLGIECVPVLGYGTLQDAIDIVSTGITFNSGGGVVKWGNGGLKSQWGDFEAEGIVARPMVPLFNRMGERIITKIKSVDFK